MEYDEENDLTLVSVKLYTGRHHQIRVQLAGIGYPLWGDVKYNPLFLRKKVFPALYAYELSLKKSPEGEIMSFSDYPAEYPFAIFNFCKKN